jgi:hydroxymethylglutaryl-CoA reductase
VIDHDGVRAAKGSAEKGPPRLSRLTRGERADFLASVCEDGDGLLAQAFDPETLHGLAEKMIENAAGFFALPFGLAEGFVINGESLTLPMVTEEPSVVAAASFAAGLIRLGGGLSAEADPAEVTAQVWLEQVPGEVYAAYLGANRKAGQNFIPEEEAFALEASMQERLEHLAREALPSLAARGGGFVSGSVKAIPGLAGVARLHLHLNVCDAMGANYANTFAEAAKPLLEECFGGRALAGILTNESSRRRARARFSLPLRLLRRKGISGEEIARRLALFSEIARHDRARAVTSNKGIMNGITALALATGNDSRAVEAAAHAWAARGGRYLPLSRYSLNEGCLTGEIELPLPLGAVSSTAKLHPGAMLSLALLGKPDAPRLAAIAAALGLAQNLAALLALVGEGINEGHMRLHARRTQ